MPPVWEMMDALCCCQLPKSGRNGHGQTHVDGDDVGHGAEGGQASPNFTEELGTGNLFFLHRLASVGVRRAAGAVVTYMAAALEAEHAPEGCFGDCPVEVGEDDAQPHGQKSSGGDVRRR